MVSWREDPEHEDLFTAPRGSASRPAAAFTLLAFAALLRLPSADRGQLADYRTSTLIPALLFIVTDRICPGGGVRAKAAFVLIAALFVAPCYSATAGRPGTLLFPSAFANHTHTAKVLEYALTGKNQYNDVPLETAFSLLETARAAGYETWWLSNQIRFGPRDSPVGVIASSAAHEVWLNLKAGQQIASSFYDGSLIEKMPRPGRGTNALIIVHLMGCHADYEERYPKSFTAFGGGLSDRYGNSVLYRDFVLRQIYDALAALPDFRALVFSPITERIRAADSATRARSSRRRCAAFRSSSSVRRVLSNGGRRLLPR